MGDQSAELGWKKRAREVLERRGFGGRASVGRRADGEVPDAFRLAVLEAVHAAVSGVVERLERDGARQRGLDGGLRRHDGFLGKSRGSLRHVVEDSVGLDFNGIGNDGSASQGPSYDAATSSRRDARGDGDYREGE